MYRKARHQDLDGILTFCLELKAQDAKMSFTDYDTPENLLLSYSDENIHLYVAEEDGQIVAMFRAIRGVGNKVHSCYVAAAVKADYRKKNLASELTAFGLEDMKSIGVLIARTKIYSWNTASIATIKKCGFVESGRIVMHQYEPDIGDYIDDLIFHKLL